MLINHDYSYINARDQKLIDAGYGIIVPDYVWFDRHFTEAQIAENRYMAETVSREEFEKRIAAFEVQFNESLASVIDVFNGKYDIHQASEAKSTREHYNSDWDLYFWSDRGQNNSQRMTRFSFSFNKKRSPDSRVDMLGEILDILNGIDCNNVVCRIQYKVHLNDVAIEEAAAKVYNSLEGKFIDYYGTGKIKIVSEYNGMRTYGFFKKGAKSKYYRLSASDVALMGI